MASSGTIQKAIRTGYRVQIAWSVDSQSIENNTSTVTAKVQLVSTGSSYTINSSATKNGSLSINGTSYSFTFNASLTGSQTKTIFTKTVTVAHNSDGTKSCSFSCSAGIAVTLGGTYYGTVTASGTGAFNTIARASSISSVTASVSVNGTNECTVNISRKSSNFTHTVVFSFGSYSKTTTGVGTSTSYAIPMSWLNAIPKASSGTAKVTVTTYSGSTKIGSAVSKTFTLTVPSSVVPTISSVTIAEATTGLAAKFGAYIQNKSKVKVTTVAAGAYSSTITSYKTTMNSVSYSGSTITTGFIKTSGNVTITITVKDSRGRSATVTRTISVLAYSAPKINSFSVFRSTAAGAQDYEGAKSTAKMKFSITSLGSKNDKAYKIEYKAKADTTWTQAVTGSVYSLDSATTLTPDFSTEASFDIRLTVTDYFGSATATGEIPTAFTLLDFNASGRGLAFGKVSEIPDEMEIDMNMNIYRNIFMGGQQLSDDEKNMYFQATENAQNPHNCKLYGGNGASVTSIGCWDSANSIGIWRYLAGTKNMVIDANVSLTHGNGGDEFVTTGGVTHGNRTGRVHFSNGLLIQWGVETITPVANTPTKKDVTFPVAYTSVPMVITNALSTVIGTSVAGSASAAITTTGFEAYVVRTNTTNTSVGWIAVGYRA